MGGQIYKNNHIRQVSGEKEQGELDIELIVEKYGRMVSAVCLRMIQKESIAKEASQEVWLEVIKNFSKFRGDSKVSTWLYTITYRTALKYAQKERRYSVSFLRDYYTAGTRELPIEIVDYEKDIWIKEMCNKCLTGTLHCLSNEHRLIYLFRDVVHLSYQNIAKISGKKVTYVRKIVSRARNKLKSFLNDQCTLYNPDGNCSCRMKRLVEDINLADEFMRIKELHRDVSFYRRTEEVFPRINYWKRYL